MHWRNPPHYPAEKRVSGFLSLYARAGFEVVAETLWPTRCALCDAPGWLLCPSCRMNLPYIDQWRACPACGAPFGLYECTECNRLTLSSAGRKTLPFSGCVCALVYDDAAARIVRTHKDAGERGLAAEMGFAIASAIPPEWVGVDRVIAHIPASPSARSRRGFDHGESLASEVGRFTGMVCENFLLRPRSHDQRGLSRSQRFANMQGKFATVDAPMPSKILLVDDVYTTGATLCAATDALLAAGAGDVKCATFARVY